MIFAQKMANRNLQGVQWHTEYWELVFKHYHNLDRLEDHRVRYEEALHRARRSLRCRRLWRWAFLRVVQDWLTNDRRFSLNSDRIVAAAVSQDGQKVISITDHGDMCLYVLVPYLMPGWYAVLDFYISHFHLSLSITKHTHTHRYQDENTERWNKAVEPAVQIRRERMRNLLSNQCKPVGTLSLVQFIIYTHSYRIYHSELDLISLTQ